MKRIITSFLLCFSASVLAEQSTACLSSICVGMDIKDLPKNIKWDPYKGQRSDKKLEGIDAPADTLTKLAKVLGYGGHLSNQMQIDGATVSALATIRGVCYPVSVHARFKSESGHQTHVSFSNLPSADGSTQRIIVSNISRLYADVVGDSEAEKLAKDISGKLAIPVTLGSRSTDCTGYPGISPDQPCGVIARQFQMSDKVYQLTLRLSRKMDDLRGNQELLRSYPGCSKKPSID